MIMFGEILMTSENGFIEQKLYIYIYIIIVKSLTRYGTVTPRKRKYESGD